MKNTLFQWDQDFITGNRAIDEQHYGLIMTINDLMQLSFQTESIKDRDIENLKKKLTDYTLQHFKTEEDLMEQLSVDSRHKDPHKTMHHDFVNKVINFFVVPEELKDKHKLNEINEFLIRWLAYHILSMDKSLVRQLHKVAHDGLSPKDAYDQELQETDANTEPLLKALTSLFFLVSKKNKELELINEGLEEKIKERTQDLETTNEKLEKISTTDELTGLPNRRFVMRELQHLIDHWERYGTVFSILFIDLDKFKAVNDTYGHEAGDQVLKWVSDYISRHIRKNDLLCRLGGDEFIIISPHCNSKDLVLMAEKLITRIARLTDDEKPTYWSPFFSTGVVEMSDNITSVSDLLIKADAAMYECKRSAEGSVKVFK